TCPFAVWQFGRDLTLVGLSGEVVVDYVARLEKALGPNQRWVAAYCHDVYGYLPSARGIAEGGYETRGLYSGGVGFFAPEAAEDRPFLGGFVVVAGVLAVDGAALCRRAAPAAATENPPADHVH